MPLLVEWARTAVLSWPNRIQENAGEKIVIVETISND